MTGHGLDGRRDSPGNDRGDEEIIRPGRLVRLHKSPATDERGWLGICKRIVKPLYHGTVFVD